MEKQHFYVTVGTGEIMTEPNQSEWEFEILATKEETDELKILFEEANQVALDGFLKSHIPHIRYQEDMTDDRYDQHLQQVYQWIFDHGNEEARNHIASMNIQELTRYNENKME